MVHQTRFELARVAPHAPQACASTSSAIGALLLNYIKELATISQEVYNSCYGIYKND